jgi:hypothetical protein
MGNSIRILRDQVCQDCGKVVVSSSNKFLRCVPCGRRNYYKKYMLTPEWRVRKLMAMALNRANEKKLPFDLTLDYLIHLWEDSNAACSISYRKFDLEPSGKFAQVNPDAPSIDRIVPEKGYTQGNVRFVTYHVNVALAEFGEEKLRILCKDILNQTSKT